MMRVTLVDGRKFDLDGTDSILNTEAMAIERATGWTMDEFTTRLNKQSVIALTAYVWIMAKRTEPTIRFEDVEFDFSALEADDDEAAADPKGDADSA